MGEKKLFLGIDIGSVSVNTVLMENGDIVFRDYTRIKEKPAATALKVLKRVSSDFPMDRIAGTGVTGTGGKLLSGLLNATFSNEIVAQTRGTERINPAARTVIDIGGEDAKMIMLRYDADAGKMMIEGFAMNTICAAGTGSFLDQQAVRLGISIEEEFGKLAMKSKNPPRIAGRCSVFAKTDMIHLQQEGTTDYDIVAGLCFALARAFKSNICKGRHLNLPISFHGGVAANRGMVRALKETFNIEDGNFMVPELHAWVGAIGAAIIAEENPSGFPGLEKLEKELVRNYTGTKSLKPLNSIEVSSTPAAKPPALHSEKPRRGFLGIDVGSISTNVVVIDEHGGLLARRYLPTSGRPIEMVRRGIKAVGEELGDSVEIAGAGTTGSGRYLIGDFVGADIVKNEITAQATASIHIDPEVDTIFEIGGQDSKYISVADGAIVDFEMNKVCAAGTGSFLEEQAEKLGVKIKEEFAHSAFSSKTPVNLGERCTVFMESDVVHHRQSMASTEDLCAGLCYSIARNYLNRVVGKRRIGDKIFFQGAVALNKGVVAAFREILGKPITVPPNNDVTGAIGVALVARNESSAWSKSRFNGWEKIVKTEYELTSFECRDCPNHCEIREVKAEGKKPLYYGSRCEKYNRGEERDKNQSNLPDLFAEREKHLLNSCKVENPGVSGKIGIPRALLFFDQYPFWSTFLKELGFEIVLSDRTNKTIARLGLDRIAGETCFPVKVAHGHIANLLEKKVDYIFLPMVINVRQKNPKMQQSFNCPYVQTLPFMAGSAFDFKEHGVEVLKPVIPFGWGRSFARKKLAEFGRQLGFSKKKTLQAAESAWRSEEEYLAKLRKRGQEVLNSLPAEAIPVVIVSRSYNGCDPGINLNLPEKLRKLGAYPIPLDYLPLDSVDLSEEWPSMYWRGGQKILAAAKIIRENTRLQCLYITNFGCGPDSFITQFFREQMKGKPYLEIEVDEHSADVGAITRCEAFLDSLKNTIKKGPPPPPERKKAFAPLEKIGKDSVIYIPYMGDISYALRSAMRAEGFSAELFPMSNEETLDLGRKFTCGKECYPCIITTGDMLRVVKDPSFNPDKTIFIMPAAMGPCRFGQYNRLQRMILDDMGLKNVPIVSPNQVNNLEQEFKAFGKTVVRNTWKGIVAIDILENMVRKTRPYETNQGDSDRIYREYLARLNTAMENKEDLRGIISEAARSFGGVSVRNRGEKPAIGLVGEIFVRSNEFSNDYLARRLEKAGAEVWQASVSEWFLHVNRTVTMHDAIHRRYGPLLLNLITGFIQKHDKHLLEKAVSPHMEEIQESSIKETWKDAEPYLPGWFGEAALSIGRSEDYARQGASGIVNVMPFTCLPGTIGGILFKRFQEDHDNIPFISMAYDGLEQINTEMRLESFVYQAAQYKNMKNR